MIRTWGKGRFRQSVTVTVNSNWSFVEKTSVMQSLGASRRKHVKFVQFTRGGVGWGGVPVPFRLSICVSVSQSIDTGINARKSLVDPFGSVNALPDVLFEHGLNVHTIRFHNCPHCRTSRVPRRNNTSHNLHNLTLHIITGKGRSTRSCRYTCRNRNTPTCHTMWCTNKCDQTREFCSLNRAFLN